MYLSIPAPAPLAATSAFTFRDTLSSCAHNENATVTTSAVSDEVLIFKRLIKGVMRGALSRGVCAVVCRCCLIVCVVCFCCYAVC